MSTATDGAKARLLACPKVKFNDGHEIPILGLGVYQAKGKECYQAVKWALEAGYRHIDTAELYGNEKEVGKAVVDSGVPRSEVYITSKVWNSSQGYNQTIKACKDSLKRLGTDYIDLYLIHSPQEGTRKDTWRAMEQLQKDGLVKSIGISNYGVKHIKEMDAYATVKPAVNQLELHPFLQRREIVAECQKRGIAVEPWGSITRGQKFGDPRLQKIAEKHGKTPAQVLLRWAIDHNYIVLPKSVHQDRILSNADVFDFKLDKDDLDEMAKWDSGGNVGWDPTTWN
ncbi:aldo/keto reductase [Hyaloraphidium curvatum]|nr:aldo/keto reductase [Hyaloraphidium curvatum]